MFEAGLEAEVKSLIAKSYTKDSPGMKAIGYSEWFDQDGNLYGPEKLEEIKENIKHHSTKYAKKQYTYIRDIPGSQVIDFSPDCPDYEKIVNICKNLL
jgi:tRNA dimethylallyltransferase